MFKLKPLYSDSLQSGGQQRDEKTFYIICCESGTFTPCVGHAESSAFLKTGTLYTRLGLSNVKCSSSCQNLWCPVNADSWEIQKCAMLGVLSSLSPVLAKGIVPYTACVSPGSSSFPLHISVSSMISQGGRASLCLCQDQHPVP